MSKNQILWAIKTVSSIRFLRSWLGKFLLLLQFIEGIEIRNHQLYLPCPYNNEFKSGNERVFEVNRLV